MTAVFALAAFVAGAWAMQQQAALPGAGLLLMASIAATVVLAASIALGRRSAGHRRRIARLGVLSAAIVLGAAHAAWVATWRLGDELAFADEGRDVRIIGVVASLPAQLVRGTRFEFDIESIESRSVHVPAHVSIGWFTPLAETKPGERWRFTARFKRPHGLLNPGGFDLEAWMLERNLRATGYVRETAGDAPERLATMVWKPGYLVDRGRSFLRERLQQRLHDRRYGGVLVALVLGDQRAISEDDWLLFNRTGISHLVSISGLHITMIAGLVGVVAGGLWRRSARLLALAPAQTAAALAAMSSALAYCLLAGWGVPAQRTFFMLATVAAAILLRAGTRASTTLAIAAAVVTLLDPWSVLAPGFWLSFGAVAAIFLATGGRAAQQPRGWRERLVEGVRIQVVVTIALLPLTILLFQQVSVVSPLANAIAIPVVSLLVTPLALIASLFVALPEPASSIATPLLAVAHLSMTLLADLLSWTLQWRAATIVLPSPPPWVGLLAAGGAAWLLAPPGLPMRWAGAVWLVPIFIWPAEKPRAGEVWVTALDVGQGSALVVETRAQVLVYDTGPRYSPQSDAGSRVVLPYLRLRGIRGIDVLVVSHLDSDHSGGAASILKTLEVDVVWTSIEPDHPLLARAKLVRRCYAGAPIAFEALTVLILHPTAADYALPARNTNARSCVLELHRGDLRVLLTGDLPAAQESELVARAPDLHATLLTAPHHGSRNSSSEPFVRATAPSWVVAQAGYRNRFGHPDAFVLERYAAVGASTVRTDFAGATQWRFGVDTPPRVRMQRIDAARYWHNQPAAPGVNAQAPRRDEPALRDIGGFDAVSPRD